MSMAKSATDYRFHGSDFPMLGAWGFFWLQLNFDLFQTASRVRDSSATGRRRAVSGGIFHFQGSDCLAR
jgi:hypothetical protein